MAGGDSDRRRAKGVAGKVEHRAEIQIGVANGNSEG